MNKLIVLVLIAGAIAGVSAYLNTGAVFPAVCFWAGYLLKREVL